MTTTLIPNSSNFIKIHNPNPQFHKFQSTITSAKPNHKKNFLTSNLSKKTIISLARFAASNLHHILPTPFNSVIQELNFSGGYSGGGGGGSGGSWNRFRWGGFDGRKRRPNNKSRFWFWGFVIVCCVGLGFCLLVLDLEIKNDAVLAAMCVSMFLVLLRNGLVPEWVLGFCGGAAFVGLLVNKKDELKKGLRTATRRYSRIK